MALYEAFLDDPDSFIPYFVIGGGLLVGLTIAAIAIAAGILQSRDRERTRREIAAYLAEGSLTDDQAERLLASKIDA